MNTNGVGLGLFICKQITQLFGGKICVRSELEVGTSFFFSFNIDDGWIEDNEDCFNLQTGDEVNEIDSIYPLRQNHPNQPAVGPNSEEEEKKDEAPEA